MGREGRDEWGKAEAYGWEWEAGKEENGGGGGSTWGSCRSTVSGEAQNDPLRRLRPSEDDLFRLQGSH